MYLLYDLFMVAVGAEYFELFCEINEPNYLNIIYSLVCTQ